MIPINVWFEPVSAPTVDSNRQLVAADALPAGMTNVVAQFYAMKEHVLGRKITWTDYAYVWIRPRGGNTFSRKELGLLEHLTMTMGKGGTLREFMTISDAPHCALIAHKHDSDTRPENFHGELRRKCTQAGGKLIVSTAPDLVSFYRESSL